MDTMTTGETMTTTMTTLSAEHQDLLGTLATHRQFLRTTIQGLSDEQAGRRPTASALCIGGLIKHVAGVETNWANFVTDGAPAVAFDGSDSEAAARWSQFSMEPDDTVAGVLAYYDEVADRTAAIIAAEDDLGRSQLLPEAPWFPPGAAWSVRRVVLHMIAETAQHAGHADIIRETIDGAKTMG
jgi:uncharacterized damage-inducible protein DinB